MITIKEISKDSSTDVLDRLLTLHQELDQQEIVVSKVSNVDALEGYDGWFDNVEKCFEDKIVFGAWYEDVLVGFIACKTVEGYIGYVGIVSLLYVTPDYQRKGVARQLWERVLTFFGKSIHHVTLDVFVGNESAIRFYESIGFKPYMFTMGYKP